MPEQMLSEGEHIRVLAPEYIEHAIVQEQWMTKSPPHKTITDLYDTSKRESVTLETDDNQPLQYVHRFDEIVGRSTYVNGDRAYAFRVEDGKVHSFAWRDGTLNEPEDAWTWKGITAEADYKRWIAEDPSDFFEFYFGKTTYNDAKSGYGEPDWRVTAKREKWLKLLTPRKGRHIHLHRPEKIAHALVVSANHETTTLFDIDNPTSEKSMQMFDTPTLRYGDVAGKWTGSFDHTSAFYKYAEALCKNTYFCNSKSMTKVEDFVKSHTIQQIIDMAKEAATAVLTDSSDEDDVIDTSPTLRTGNEVSFTKPSIRHGMIVQGPTELLDDEIDVFDFETLTSEWYKVKDLEGVHVFSQHDRPKDSWFEEYMVEMYDKSSRKVRCGPNAHVCLYIQNKSPQSVVDMALKAAQGIFAWRMPHGHIVEARLVMAEAHAKATGGRKNAARLADAQQFERECVDALLAEDKIHVVTVAIASGHDIHGVVLSAAAVCEVGPWQIAPTKIKIIVPCMDREHMAQLRQHFVDVDKELARDYGITSTATGSVVWNINMYQAVVMRSKYALPETAYTRAMRAWAYKPVVTQQNDSSLTTIMCGSRAFAAHMVCSRKSAVTRVRSILQNDLCDGNDAEFVVIVPHTSDSFMFEACWDNHKIGRGDIRTAVNEEYVAAARKRKFIVNAFAQLLMAAHNEDKLKHVLAQHRHTWNVDLRQPMKVYVPVGASPRVIHTIGRALLPSDTMVVAHDAESIPRDPINSTHTADAVPSAYAGKMARTHVLINERDEPVDLNQLVDQEAAAWIAKHMLESDGVLDYLQQEVPTQPYPLDYDVQDERVASVLAGAVTADAMDVWAGKLHRAYGNKTSTCVCPSAVVRLGDKGCTLEWAQSRPAFDMAAFGAAVVPVLQLNGDFTLYIAVGGAELLVMDCYGIDGQDDAQDRAVRAFFEKEFGSSIESSTKKVPCRPPTRKDHASLLMMRAAYVISSLGDFGVADVNYYAPDYALVYAQHIDDALKSGRHLKVETTKAAQEATEYTDEVAESEDVAEASRETALPYNTQTGPSRPSVTEGTDLVAPALAFTTNVIEDVATLHIQRHNGVKRNVWGENMVSGTYGFEPTKEQHAKWNATQIRLTMLTSDAASELIGTSLEDIESFGAANDWMEYTGRPVICVHLHESDEQSAKPQLAINEGRTNKAFEQAFKRGYNGVPFVVCQVQRDGVSTNEYKIAEMAPGLKLGMMAAWCFDWDKNAPLSASHMPRVFGLDVDPLSETMRYIVTNSRGAFDTDVYTFDSQGCNELYMELYEAIYEDSGQLGQDMSSGQVMPAVLKALESLCKRHSGSTEKVADDIRDVVAGLQYLETMQGGTGNAFVTYKQRVCQVLGSKVRSNKLGYTMFMYDGDQLRQWDKITRYITGGQTTLKNHFKTIATFVKDLEDATNVSVATKRAVNECIESHTEVDEDRDIVQVHTEAKKIHFYIADAPKMHAKFEEAMAAVVAVPSESCTDLEYEADSDITEQFQRDASSLIQRVDDMKQATTALGSIDRASTHAFIQAMSAKPQYRMDFGKVRIINDALYGLGDTRYSLKDLCNDEDHRDNKRLKMALYQTTVASKMYALARACIGVHVQAYLNQTGIYSYDAEGRAANIDVDYTDLLKDMKAYTTYQFVDQRIEDIELTKKDSKGKIVLYVVNKKCPNANYYSYSSIGSALIMLGVHPPTVQELLNQSFTVQIKVGGHSDVIFIEHYPGDYNSKALLCAVAKLIKKNIVVYSMHSRREYTTDHANVTFVKPMPAMQSTMSERDQWGGMDFLYIVDTSKTIGRPDYTTAVPRKRSSGWLSGLGF